MDNFGLSVMVKNIAVSEQVGELVIHCRYGCKLPDNNPGSKYEVDPEGCPFTFPLKDRRYGGSFEWLGSVMYILLLTRLCLHSIPYEKCLLLSGVTFQTHKHTVVIYVK